MSSAKAALASNVKINFAVDTALDEDETNQRLRRRQESTTSETGYITSDGQVVSSVDCDSGTTYTLNGLGMLGTNDGTEYYSTDDGIASAPFETNSQLGAISTNWTIDGTQLIWMNETFLNGAAAICKSGSDLTIYYTEATPSGCTPIILSLLPQDDCASADAAASSSLGLVGVSSQSSTSMTSQQTSESPNNGGVSNSGTSNVAANPDPASQPQGGPGGAASGASGAPSTPNTNPINGDQPDGGTVYANVNNPANDPASNGSTDDGTTNDSDNDAANFNGSPIPNVQDQPNGNFQDPNAAAGPQLGKLAGNVPNGELGSQSESGGTGTQADRHSGPPSGPYSGSASTGATDPSNPKYIIVASKNGASAQPGQGNGNAASSNSNSQSSTNGKGGPQSSNNIGDTTPPNSNSQSSPSENGAISQPLAAGSTSTGTCSQSGQSICSPDGSQIGLCTESNTVTYLAVAPGTKCSKGHLVHANSNQPAGGSSGSNFPPPSLKNKASSQPGNAKENNPLFGISIISPLSQNPCIEDFIRHTLSHQASIPEFEKQLIARLELSLSDFIATQGYGAAQGFDGGDGGIEDYSGQSCTALTHIQEKLAEDIYFLEAILNTTYTQYGKVRDAMIEVC